MLRQGASLCCWPTNTASAPKVTPGQFTCSACALPLFHRVLGLSRRPLLPFTCCPFSQVFLHSPGQGCEAWGREWQLLGMSSERIPGFLRS